MSDYEASWLRAFLLTLALEVPLATFLLRRFEPSPLRRATLAAFANLSTHPLVWFVVAQLSFSWTQRTAIAEAWAVVAEALFYVAAFRSLGLARASLISLATNACSFALGLLLGLLGVLR